MRRLVLALAGTLLLATAAFGQSGPANGAAASPGAGERRIRAESAPRPGARGTAPVMSGDSAVRVGPGGEVLTPSPGRP